MLDWGLFRLNSPQVFNFETTVFKSFPGSSFLVFMWFVNVWCLLNSKVFKCFMFDIWTQIPSLMIELTGIHNPYFNNKTINIMNSNIRETLLNMRRSTIHQNKELVVQYQKGKKRRLRHLYSFFVIF